MNSFTSKNKKRHSFYFFVVTILFFIPGTMFAKMPNDSLLDEQWYLGTIHAFDAWDTTSGSPEVIVAVLDTGLDLDHPDLSNHVWINPGEIPNDGRDNDGNGFIDDIHGWDFVDGDATPEPTISAVDQLDQGAISHGTVIAGIIGAVTDNGEGIAGINWHVRIMSVRILNNIGSGDSSKARRAIEYAVKNGADVINLSFTGFEVDEDFLQAVQDAYEQGVTVVAAVGNDENGGVNLNEQPIYPACFVTKEGVDVVIGVAATDEEDRKASFSNYGSYCTDLAAPGVDVIGTMYQDGLTPETMDLYGGYWSGTSIAAPMVAGAAALLKAAYPTLSPDQIRTVLQLSVDPTMERNSPSAGQLGSGRLNIMNALNVAKSFAPAVLQTSTVSSPNFSLAVAEASGGEPRVVLFDRHGNSFGTFLAYASEFRGGVRLASGDLDGDGQEEFITGAGPGGGPQVRIFEKNETVRNQFFAYGSDDHFGIFVSSGDFDGNDLDEILTAQDEGGEGEVRIFDSSGKQLFSFYPFDHTSKSVRIASGDLDGDGKDEILATLGSGGKPFVRAFRADGTFLAEFEAYASTYDRGIFVSAGDLNGDGKDEIVTGTDNGGGPQVRIFTADGTVIGSFFAFDETFRGGVRVQVADLDRDGTAEIYTGAGPGGGPQVRMFDRSGRVLGSFFAFDEKDRYGLNVAAW
ncbi:MAG: peptidase S8 and S53, subtilisin, kexin, sedolisin [Candidatus Uhrbacteria bacterium GW2011_GWF2_41_16]|uniref:Peptidase S8 and S53, subtilisin, kexin, sedolisin n=2 Tax=Candidatus Uhriibacteriota TaxID=1752732 RepID=A0A0G0YBG7_9BACT|nr:MAG: peptidase S8 and S53, subtilisin, kexin, sedolisin [Candidatus Uhrbacteria bacterium GW2011_GWA2_41_10]KKR87068.1 MAG: peptidase S8 and S53, subtilisin, kexin, sedolisin [Candidatus Uhrbacteria bacterium GW2011_GWC2_41_11]KKR97632.1 MAG: peptidase S8 and S53, subtilisin, kexin, sedolisin [Candidatus Uhrbacteria bacterium GW2011_GWF2_41_16]HBP00458.1 hypothetical protein [Candidatus Uhrbacteria bacterium]